MLPTWARDYVGVPFLAHGRDARGWDCWGMFRYIEGRHFGLDLPSYAGEYADDLEHEEVAAAIARNMPEAWREVQPDEAVAGDGVLLRISGSPMHVGLVLDPPWFLHVIEGTETCVERWDAPKWSRRFLGVYRHV